MGEEVARTWADFFARWKARVWRMLEWILEVSFDIKKDPLSTSMLQAYLQTVMHELVIRFD